MFIIRRVTVHPKNLTVGHVHTTASCRHADEVRVRFAPSPTGHIHLGGLRTAFYNYVFARQHQGKFILRIEDTDRARIVPGSEQEIENTLDWAGLSPDESPQKGGSCGPYRQSQRLLLYKQRAQWLLDHGKAYRCFCSPTRLDLLRKFQAKNREKIRYDGKCKSLTQDEIEEKLAEHDGQHVIRFSLLKGNRSINDLIFGQVTANLVEALESDPVIIKSDGYPTYHFASVVDDHDMKISHVLRGSEWISSSIKHVQLYEALQWRAPEFAHFPLITMRDGSKMSKRNDNSHVSSWIRAGYQPLTLFNFLTNSGGGVPKTKQDSMEFWTLDEFVQNFNFKQVTCHPSSLDLNRLHVYSAQELRQAWLTDPDLILGRFRGLACAQNVDVDLDDEAAKSVIGRLVDRLTSVNDLLHQDYLFLWHKPKLSWPVESYVDYGWDLRDIIGRLKVLVQNVGLDDKDEFINGLKKISSELKIDYPKLMGFVRNLLTNNDRGLPVHDICQCLGAPRLKQYLDKGLDYVNGKV